MKITSTTSYTVKFQVHYFLDCEGGMQSDTFGPECDTIQLAITQLELAQVHDPKMDWVIVCAVAKEVK